MNKINPTVARSAKEIDINRNQRYGGAGPRREAAQQLLRETPPEETLIVTYKTGKGGAVCAQTLSNLAETEWVLGKGAVSGFREVRFFRIRSSQLERYPEQPTLETFPNERVTIGRGTGHEAQENRRRVIGCILDAAKADGRILVATFKDCGIGTFSELGTVNEVIAILHCRAKNQITELKFYVVPKSRIPEKSPA
jgi:hypothetical protein